MTTAVLDFPTGAMTGLTQPRPGAIPGRLWGLTSLGGGTGSEPLWFSRVCVEPEADRVELAVAPEPAAVLREIRRISGLTLEELAFALDVSRRTLHNWDAGQPVRSRHLDALHRLAGLLRRLDPGNPLQMRNLLLMDLSGRNALALIQDGQWTVVERFLAPRIVRRPQLAPLPEAEARRRRPQGVPLSAYANEPVEVLPDRPLPRVKLPGLRKG